MSFTFYKVIQVLRIDYPEWKQSTIMQVMLSRSAWELTPELKHADLLLQEGSLEESIISRFSTNSGRPTVPVRVYLRLMFLKSYLGLSYEALVPEVSHNLMYRIFCRIPDERNVPDDSSLVKITKKYGGQTVDETIRRIIRTTGGKKRTNSRKATH